MKTIGVIGTAKNTGKTTTLSFLLNGFQSRGLNLAVTGIGYDGEEIDNITNLPKPRLYFKKDTILATSEKCLTQTVAEFQIIGETPFSTALGKISIVKIIKPGMVVIAGPNRAAALKQIINQIKEISKSDILLVDGSLNRISPMYILDKLIFTTGASRNINIDQLGMELQLIEKVFSYRKSDLHFNTDDNIKILYEGVTLNLYNNTLVDQDDFYLLESSLNVKAKKIIIPGLISIEKFYENYSHIAGKIIKPFEIILNSPLQLLLTENFQKVSSLLGVIKKNKTEISYQNKPELMAVTINPFYPKFDNYKYIPSYLDKEKFLNEMTVQLKTPVINILEPGSERIFDLI